MQNKGIAIFGGSFNPPLNSHLELAKQVIKNLCNIEKVIFVPVSTKYNRKNNLTDDAHRYKMLKLMCNGEEKLEVSDVELSYGRQLYTIETLDIFKNEYPEYDIYFIMGTDNLKDLHTWKESERILKNYKIIVLERNEDNLEKIKNGEEVESFFKKEVLEYINKNGLYKL